MPVEKFFQRLRSGESPRGHRSRNMGPDRERTPVRIEIPLDAIRKELPGRPKVLPVYNGDERSRALSLWRGKRTGAKPMPHPMRGFRSPKASHRNAA